MDRNEISTQEVFAILGQKEIERLLLIDRVQKLEARIKELETPKTLKAVD